MSLRFYTKYLSQNDNLNSDFLMILGKKKNKRNELSLTLKKAKVIHR